MKTYSKMKDSDVEWIGEIPEHWKSYKLKFIFDVIKNGIWGSDPLNDEHDVICIRVADFNRKKNSIDLKNPTIRNISFDEKKKYLLEKGDLLLERSGGGRKQPVGFTVIYHDEVNAVCSNFISRLKPNKNFNSKFLNHFFAAMYINRENVKYINQTTGIQNLDSDYLNKIYPLPPINEQNEIEKFIYTKITKIDSKLQKNQKMIDLLKEKQSSLVQYTITKGLDKTVQLKDSGIDLIGKIPESWNVNYLKYIMNDMVAGPFGSSIKKEEYVEAGYKVYGQEQVIPNDFSIGDYYISEIKFQKLKRFKIHSDDILISCVGTFGKIAIVPKEIELGIINPRLIKLTPNDKLILSDYLFEFLKSYYAFSQLEKYSRGGTMNIINLGLLSSMILPIPPLNEQKLIINFLKNKTDNIEKLKNKIQIQIEKLKEFRKSIISSAVTGKIDVREAIA